MFDKDMQIRGKYATYWKALSQVPGNAIDTSNNFKIFENYIYVFMVAPIIGLNSKRKGQPDPKDESKDTAGMLAAVQIKNAAKLKYIYRLIILNDDTLGLSDEEKIDFAFREDGNPEAVEKGMKLYMEYFYGGLDILYETFVQQCTTDDDYTQKMYEFVQDFKQEQGIDALSPDIEALLRQ